jgi:hypothetical protein
LGIVGILLAAVAAAVPVSAGPIGFQASAGVNTEGEDFCLGAGARIGLGPITLIPNGEWFFVDSGTNYTLNLDGTLSVLSLGVASAYVGAGTGMVAVDPDPGDSNTEAALNVIAGAGLNVLLSPFAQVKLVMIDGSDSQYVISAGVRF